jgi:hypothetical protein
VEQARTVITRLDRIEAMERASEPAELVLRELALLVAEAELWLESERSPGAAARVALERCLRALQAGARGGDHGAESFARLKSR